MKTERAAHIVFGTPELAFTVFASLTPHDLTQCIRVCKDWQHYAEPVLWTNFCYGGFRRTTLPPKTTAGLVRNLPHIRVVELPLQEHAVLQELVPSATEGSQPRDSALDPRAPCTQLRRLSLANSESMRNGMYSFTPYIIKDFPPVLSNIVTLLSNNVHLTHLTFPFPEVTADDPVLVAISNLKNLQYLAVNSNNSSSMSMRSIALLLRVSLPLPKLTGLCINSGNSGRYWNEGDVMSDIETIIKEAAIARFSQTPTPVKIKALQLPCSLEDKETPLTLAFLKSDLLDLETFRMPPFDNDSHWKTIYQLFDERHPNLKHLRYSFHTDNRDDTQCLLSCIRGCSGLRSFASDGFRDQAYRAEDDSDVSRCIFSDLVRHHCDTLEDIELKSCFQVTSGDLQNILSRCKQLKRLHVSGLFKETRDDRHLDGDAGFDIKDALKDVWVCTELRELWITLGRNSFLDVDRFYRQIGRLEKLEHLTLDVHRRRYVKTDMWGDDIYNWDYDVNHRLLRSSLDEMAGLKNLKSLRLAAELCKEMGQPEVEFIREHWPMLREITILGSKGLKLLTKKRWQWLFNKWPHLRLNVLDNEKMIEAMRYI
ncbi:hypothetical protein BGZ68_008000 [Mortierella alpina]|nr:hypothetical protein BGZ68_008000 [Mortierella alpina]